MPKVVKIIGISVKPHYLCYYRLLLSEWHLRCQLGSVHYLCEGAGKMRGARTFYVARKLWGYVTFSGKEGVNFLSVEMGGGIVILVL